ncbi:MAG: hypothetical protein AAGA56_18780 [Myxococcota bacterium]
MRTLFLLLGLCAACTTTVTVTSDDQARTDDDPVESNSGTTTTTVIDPGGGGGPVDLCEGYEDEGLRDTVVIDVVNTSAAPIYFGTDCGQVFPQVASLDGLSPELEYVAWSLQCANTCEQLMVEGPLLCGACPELARLVGPGESVTVEWAGLAYRQHTVPPECLVEPMVTGPTCPQIVAAPQQRYDVSLEAFEACATPGGEECTCNEEGVCSGSAFNVTDGPPNVRRATVTLGDGQRPRFEF